MPVATSTYAPSVLDDLRSVFGSRLEALVAYAPERTPRPSVAIVSSLEFADLELCARHAGAWRRAGAAAPVLLTRSEFARSLDVFPVEFGAIVDTHEVLWGDDPFTGLAVDPRDLRRACEGQVRSLLLHLREDYVEAGGRAAAVRSLVVDSAPEFRALLSVLARLDGPDQADRNLPAWAAERLGLEARTVADLLHVANHPDTADVDTSRLFRDYVATTERLAARIDQW